MHRRDRDHTTLHHDGHVLGGAVDEGGVHPAAPDVELHRGPGLALEALDDLLARLAEGRPVADADDLVVAREAREVGGARVDRAGDGEEAVLAVDVDVGTDAAVLRLEVLLELLPGLRVEERGVRVHALEQALHGGLEQLVPAHPVALDVEAADHLDEGLEAPQLGRELAATGRQQLLALGVRSSQLGVLEAADRELLEVGLGEAALGARFGGHSLEHGHDSLDGLHHAQGGEGQGGLGRHGGIARLQELEEEAAGTLDLRAKGDLVGRCGAADPHRRAAVAAGCRVRERRREARPGLLVRSIEAAGHREVGSGHDGLEIVLGEDGLQGRSQCGLVGIVALEPGRDQEQDRAGCEALHGQLTLDRPVEGGSSLVAEDPGYGSRLAEHRGGGGVSGLQGLLGEQLLELVLEEGHGRGRPEDGCRGGRDRGGGREQEEQGVHGGGAAWPGAMGTVRSPSPIGWG